jgi:hypothetical protein
MDILLGFFASVGFLTCLVFFLAGCWKAILKIREFLIIT